MKEGRWGNTQSMPSISGPPPASSSESDADPNKEGCFAYAHTSANLLIDLLGPSEEDTTTNAVLPSIFVFGRDCECAATVYAKGGLTDAGVVEVSRLRLRGGVASGPDWDGWC